MLTSEVVKKMKKIAVLYNNELYAWVDTVVHKDEYDYILAVLVNPKNGDICVREVSTITVIDNDIIN